MKEYHKIQTVFFRDPANHHKTLLLGQYARPEFCYLQGNQWEFTEKVDGTNTRIMYDGERITYGGKTDNSQIPAHLINALDGLFKERVWKFGEVFDAPACLYGEGYGAKIQKGGGNYRQDQGFVLFDVKVGDWWLQREDVVDVATKLCIDVVPIIGGGTLAAAVQMAAKGFASRWGAFTAEGIVARPKTELCTRDGERIITKIKHKDFQMPSARVSTTIQRDQPTKREVT